MNDKISGYDLDKQQQQIVLNDSNHLLVVAGAGSGKTLTILGKINYLIKYKNILPSEILCISFTRASSLSLKDKIRKEFLVDMPVYTFHKLSLEILKENNKIYDITSADTLDNVIHEFFLNTILDFPMYMEKVLRYFKIRKKFNINKEYLHFYKMNTIQIEMFERLISTFLHLFKCNNFSLEDFSIFLKKSKSRILNFNKQKEKIFLSITLNIYLIYQEYLKENNEIDFDDMIIYANNLVKNNGTKQKYKYIIIDEYQDTSYIRFLLIKSILESNNAKLMVVGDDFQSIYSFAGCDISLFLDFKNYFKDAKIMKIENTYRNSNELVSIAGDFVMRNNSQIKKCLSSNKKLDFPVRIVYYKNIKEIFIKLIIKIYKHTNKPILVLGRNNHDVYMILSDNLKLKEDGKIIYTLNGKIEIYYLTVHKSKGLEEENVIIINLEDRFLGFPNKIKDNKLLRFVKKNNEGFPYSEERRLFYVALTRTKNCVYLLSPLSNPSIFIKELLKNRNVKIDKNY